MSLQIVRMTNAMTRSPPCDEASMSIDEARHEPGVGGDHDRGGDVGDVALGPADSRQPRITSTVAPNTAMNGSAPHQYAACTMAATPR